MSKIELSPCPFCGKKEKLFVVRGSGWAMSVQPFGIRCYSCGTEIINPQSYNKKTAYEAWNTRQGQKGLVWVERHELKQLDIFPDLMQALKTIRDAFWTDGETYKDRIEDLKGIAKNAIEKAEKN